MVVTPAIKYAKSGDIHIAYQAFGEGRSDLVAVPGVVAHLSLPGRTQSTLMLWSGSHRLRE